MKNIVIEPLKSKIITRSRSKARAFSKLLEIITATLLKHPLHSGDILVITSKVVAITQGHMKKIRKVKDFNALVQVEAEEIIKSADQKVRQEGPFLTLKNNIFIPWAGIDRSNVPSGYVVLWPEEPFKVAENLCLLLKKRFKLKHFGVLITDSFCVPLRRGVSGVALGYAGFKGVNDLRGKKDLFGKKLKVTQQAIADNLATAAQLVMGESDESIPFAIIRNAPVKFTNQKVNPQEPIMPAEECLFAPFYTKNT